MANQWNVNALDGIQFSDYIVFDDIAWDNLKSSVKSFMGGQRNFSVTDKYRKKCILDGGWPCIYLFNPEDFTEEAKQFCNGDWGKLNCVVVYIPMNIPLY